MTGPDDKLPTAGTDRAAVDAFLRRLASTPAARPEGARGRLIFALDATASRGPTWDRACPRGAGPGGPRPPLLSPATPPPRAGPTGGRPLPHPGRDVRGDGRARRPRDPARLLSRLRRMQGGALGDQRRRAAPRDVARLL